MKPRDRLARKMVPKEKKPLLLMFHPGGFIYGDDYQFPDDTMAAAKAQGFKTRNVDYTLGDPNAAWAEAQQKAMKARKHGRKVFSYGESAGGALAIRLAQEKLAKRGAGFSPLTDLPWFADLVNADAALGHTEANQREVSPLHHTAKKGNQVLATVGETEDQAFGDKIRALAAQDPNEVTLKTVAGSHIGAEEDGSRDSYTAAVQMIMKWLAQRRKKRKK